MVDHIGGFLDQPFTALADRCERQFNRLLAQFLGALRHTPVQQFAGIGYVRTGGGALRDAPLQIVD